MKGNKSAFTLPEILVAAGIVAILLSLTFPAIKSIQPKVDEVICMSHLRSLWLAFAPRAVEDSGWPQLPKDIKVGSREEQQWWVDYSSDALGLDPKLWICPTIARANRGANAGVSPVIDYMPTLFDSRPGTPNRWPSMPWFTEIGDVHGKGNLSVRTDGSILPIHP